MNHETLTKELAEIQSLVNEEESKIESAKKAIHWLKKRRKLVEQQLAETKETKSTEQ